MGDNTKKYLDYSGLETLVTNIKTYVGGAYKAFKASGTNHAPGLVPDPGATQGTTKYLREDGTWAVPEGNTDLTDYVQKSEIYEQGGTFVDLGLSSGLLWAQGNIIKDTNGNYSIGEETDYGCYFSWGNIDGHNANEGYNFGTANSGPYASTPGAQVSANIASNDASHDAALACLGSPWHLPTKEDFQELYDNTDREWTTLNGINGLKFMKKSDHSVYVFFPAAGYGDDTSVYLVSTDGLYWSSSWISTDNVYYMHFDSSSVNPLYDYYRYCGFSVRAVTNTIITPAPKYAQKSELADVATSGSYNDLTNKPTFLTSQDISGKQDVIDATHKLSADLIEDGTTNKVINVKPDWNAASGSSAEILNKPSIPAAQVQSDWNATSGMGVILNKPTIPTVPTNVSAFTNDAGYLTGHQDISGKEDKMGIIAVVDTVDATLPVSSLTCETDKYYRLDVPVETLAVTLPEMSNVTVVKTVVLYLTGGTTPAVTISSTAPSGGTAPAVHFSDGYAIESGNIYEVNCAWNGLAWIVASFKINTSNS